jgi:23S rRNA pseudouridine1911/1915/1917 synthase
LEQLKTIISTDLPADPLQELPDDPAEAGPDAELRPLLVSAALHNQRLDRALVALVPEFSRSYLQQLIEAGGVTLSGKPAIKASARVKAGERGEIELRPTPQSQAFLPEPMALDVVYEDEHLLRHQQACRAGGAPCAGQLAGHAAQRPAGARRARRVLPRAGIVHRLDKDTSGLMVVARTRAAMDALVQLIAAREVSAASTWRWGTARGWVPRGARWMPHRARSAQPPAHGGGGPGAPGGKTARTDFELLANCPTGAG